MNLSYFVNQRGGNSIDVEKLVSEFYEFPPSKKFLPKNCLDLSFKFLSISDEAYAIAGMANYIFEGAMESVKMYGQNAFYSTVDLYPKTKEGAMKYYLFERAAHFKFSHLGACSFRASYAALSLSRIFNDRIKITLESTPEKDQFMVILTAENTQFVYDPLTNPDMIYEKKYYEEEILIKFPTAPKKIAKFDLEINAALSTHFFAKIADISKIMKSILKKTLEPTVSAILTHPVYHANLINYASTHGDLKKTYPKALEILNALLLEEPHFSATFSRDLSCRQNLYPLQNQTEMVFKETSWNKMIAKYNMPLKDLQASALFNLLCFYHRSQLTYKITNEFNNLIISTLSTLLFEKISDLELTLDNFSLTRMDLASSEDEKLSKSDLITIMNLYSNSHTVIKNGAMKKLYQFAAEKFGLILGLGCQQKTNLSNLA